MPKTPILEGQQALITTGDLPEGSIRAASDNPANARYEWQQYAIPLVVEFACRGEMDAFQYAEAESAMGIAPPPDPAHDPGRLMQRMRTEHLIERAGTTESKKRTGNHSLLRLWRITPAARAKYLAKVARAAADEVVAA